MALDFGKAWEYAPSLESTDHVRLQSRYELFIGGKWVAPKSGRYFPTISPSTEETLAEVAEANAEDVDLAVAAARRAYDTVWSKMRPEERAKCIFRIARTIQEKAREPRHRRVDGRRQAHQGVARRGRAARGSPTSCSGLGRQARLRLPHGRKARPLGVAGQVIPWNFPLLHGRVEAGARARVREHRRLEAGRDHAAHRAPARAPILEECRLPRAW